MHGGLWRVCCAASCSLFDVSHRGRASGKKSKNFCAKMEKDKAIKPEKEEMQNVRCCASSTRCCCCCSVTSRGRRRHERIFNMRLPVVCRPHSACCCCCNSHTHPCTHTPAHTQARIKKAKWLLLLLVDMCATNNNN